MRLHLRFWTWLFSVPFICVRRIASESEPAGPWLFTTGYGSDSATLLWKALPVQVDDLPGDLTTAYTAEEQPEQGGHLISEAIFQPELWEAFKYRPHGPLAQSRRMPFVRTVHTFVYTYGLGPGATCKSRKQLRLPSPERSEYSTRAVRVGPGTKRPLPSSWHFLHVLPP